MVMMATRSIRHLRRKGSKIVLLLCLVAFSQHAPQVFVMAYPHWLQMQPLHHHVGRGNNKKSKHSTKTSRYHRPQAPQQYHSALFYHNKGHHHKNNDRPRTISILSKHKKSTPFPFQQSYTQLHSIVPLSSLHSTTRLSRAIHAVTSTTSALRGGAAVAMGSSLTPPPPLGTWLAPALACATGFALYNLCIKKSSATMDPILGGVLLQFVAALVGSLLLFYQRVLAPSSTGTILRCTQMGLFWAVAAGLSVGAAELLSFVVSGMGVPATQSIPIIVGGSILIGTLLGAVWLQERLTRTGWIGVLLIAAGIALVGMNGTAA